MYVGMVGDCVPLVWKGGPYGVMEHDSPRPTSWAPHSGRYMETGASPRPTQWAPQSGRYMETVGKKTANPLGMESGGQAKDPRVGPCKAGG